MVAKEQAMKIENVPTFTKVLITIETAEEVQLLLEIAFYASFNQPMGKSQNMAKELKDFLQIKIASAAGHDWKPKKCMDRRST